MKIKHHKRDITPYKICLLFICIVILFITIGYSAFTTNLNIDVKGNIKDVNKKVDSKVPTNELLFWGQADNKDNTTTILKDKSDNNNNGTLYNFDNTTTSGYNNNDLVFDGVDDYVDIGYANYDFKNSVSYVIYMKMNDITKHQIIFGTWTGYEGACGIYMAINPSEGKLVFDLYDGTTWNAPPTDFIFDINKYHTIVATYDGTKASVYIDGELNAQKDINNAVNTSSKSVKIGTYETFAGLASFANMNVKEAMLYDRALTEDEALTITKGFESKYK